MKLDERALIERLLEDGSGILRLEPAWVARDLVPPGRRLGLREDQYDVGDRGFICERWLASTTKADNRIGPEDEGLSYIATNGSPRMTLAQAVAAEPARIMGAAYASAHSGLGRLAKIFDYADRLPFHLHQRAEHAALVGRKPKDEAYFFPHGFDLGSHPETFFGLHPWIVDEKAYDTLLPYLTDWDSDLILQHSRAELQVRGSGFHVPSGVLHAPGTALTIELQEDSDVFAMLQARNAGRIISKDLMFKDVRPEDRARYGERFILQLIDWDLNGDPYFYENRHLTPRLIGSPSTGAAEYWIFYNSSRFSGKQLVLPPTTEHLSIDAGVYSLLVLQGAGTVGGLPVRAGEPTMDELLVTYRAATAGLKFVNQSATNDMIVIKFFGPGINTEAPVIEARRSA
jgi:hypothetical protein